MPSTQETGLFQHLAQAFVAVPFNQMLGVQLDQLDPQHVVMSFAMKQTLIGNFLHGILHGGVISSVLDMAGGMVVMAQAIQRHASVPPEELVSLIGKCSTIDLQVSFVRPGRGEIFIAKAYLVKSGNKISFTRMELLNQADDLIATGNGTYLF